MDVARTSTEHLAQQTSRVQSASQYHDTVPLMGHSLDLAASIFGIPTDRLLRLPCGGIAMAGLQRWLGWLTHWLATVRQASGHLQMCQLSKFAEDADLDIPLLLHLIACHVASSDS